MATNSQMDRHSNLLERCLDSLEAYHKLIRENLEDPTEKSAALEKVNGLVKDYCTMDVERRVTTRTVQLVTEHLNRDDVNEQEVDIDVLFRDKLSSAGVDDFWDHRQHAIYKRFFNDEGDDGDVMEVEPKASRQPDASTFVELQDSLYCSDVFVPPMDPCGKKMIQDPYKNKVCGHIYEYESIRQHIINSSKRAKKANCPYVGCTNDNLMMSQLAFDETLKNKIRNHLAENGFDSD